MKTIIKKTLRRLRICTVFFLLIIVVSFASLRFFSPYLQHHREDIAAYISNIMQQPIQIGTVGLSSHGIEPVLQLGNVVIWNDTKTKVLLQANELQIGLDIIGSLIKRSVKPGFLLLRGTNLNLYQDEQHNIKLRGINTTIATGADSSVSDMLHWMCEQGKIELRDVSINWRFANNSQLKVLVAYLRLRNNNLQHRVNFSGNLVQQNITVKFGGRLTLQGNILQHDISSMVGDVTVEDFTFKSTTGFTGTSGVNLGWLPPHGELQIYGKRLWAATSYLRQPVTLDHLAMEINWQKLPERWEIDLNNLLLQNNIISLRGYADLILPAVAAPEVNAKFNFKVANLGQVKAYYPAKIMAQNLVTWLDQSILYSKPVRGDFLLRGPLAKFPFTAGGGQMLIRSELRDVTLKYNQDWPALERLYGKIVFANSAMSITVDKAKLLHEDTGKITAIIPDLNDPVLTVNGVMNTDSKVGWQVINLSPLQDSIGKRLAPLSFSGPMDFSLQLILPLGVAVQKTMRDQVNGVINLHDNYLRARGLNLVVNNLAGKITFTADSVSAPDLSGTMFAHPVKFVVSTVKQSQTVTEIKMLGQVAISDLSKALNFNLTKYLSGATDYQAVFQLLANTNGSVLNLTSDLQGIKVLLPQPFAKAANTPSKFSLHSDLDAKQGLRFFLNYAEQITATLSFKYDSKQNLKLDSGAIKLGRGAVKISMASGLVLAGKLAYFIWDDWAPYLTSDTDSTYAGLLKQVDLTVAELLIDGLKLQHTVLHAVPNLNGWAVDVASDQLQGHIFFPAATAAFKQIKGTLQKLYLDSNVTTESIVQFNPQNIPPLDFTINDCRYDDKAFTHVAFITEPISSGLAINKLEMQTANFKLTATGSWVSSAQQQLSNLQGNFQGSDLGALFKSWNITNKMVNGKYSANFILHWLGAPYQPKLANLNGNLAVRVEGGRIVHLDEKTENELGFGRVLSLLSLQTLPRRLTLDFTDLLKSGFSFDLLEGRIKFDAGNATTEKISLDGPVASVKVSGRVGLVAKDFDLQLTTTPHVTSSIPVIAAIAFTPVAGVATWAAEKIISSQMGRVTAHTYKVTGLWDKPNIN